MITQASNESGLRGVLIAVCVVVVILVTGIVYSQFNHKNASLSVRPVDSEEIGADAADVHSPIVVREGNRVRVELQTSEVVAELSPGVTYEYWTYNGTVPGPMIRVREGDLVEIRLAHAAGEHHSSLEEAHSLSVDNFGIELALAHGPDEMGTESSADPHGDSGSHEAMGHGTHSIDLHAVIGPGGGAVHTQTGDGETHSFEFLASRPGVYVYHCASPHIPTHIANGMYGLIVVEPREGLPSVDREFYVMQGELYTSGALGEKGHQLLDRDKLLQENPEYFVFNGRVGSLTGERALRARAGERIRIFFGVGTHIASNLHLIGGIFDRLYPEGDILSPPRRNVQTTVVPPGGSAMIEFVLDVPGKYLLVDHSLTRAIDRGAVAELVIEGSPRPDLFRSLE